MSVEKHLRLLRSTKKRIKVTLENRGVSVGSVPFSRYPQLIDSIRGGGLELGKIVYNRLDLSDPNWIPCDGSQLSASDYPELAQVKGMEVDNGYIKLPNLPMVVQGDVVFQPIIKVTTPDDETRLGGKQGDIL